jgi:hypothetical protein
VQKQLVAADESVADRALGDPRCALGVPWVLGIVFALRVVQEREQEYGALVNTVRHRSEPRRDVAASPQLLGGVMGHELHAQRLERGERG